MNDTRISIIYQDFDSVFEYMELNTVESQASSLRLKQM